MNNLSSTIRFRLTGNRQAAPLRIALFPILCFMGVVIAVTSIKAHEGASGIIKQRMDTMKSMGDYAETVGDMFKGKATFDLDIVRAASETFIRHGQTIPTQFPDTPDSREGPMTEALPVIWDDWQQFTALAEKFTRDSHQLKVAADKLLASNTPDNASIRKIRSAFFKAVKSCSDCHKHFRLDRK